jgi:hypothetical protein
MTVNRSKPDQYQLRFPPGMRDRLKAAADHRGRSMNAEIIDRLDQSFKGWPKVSWSDELFERLKQAGSERRLELEKEISNFAKDLVERELPSAHILHSTLSGTFYRLLKAVPETQKQSLRDAFMDLSLELSKATAKKDAE